MLRNLLDMDADYVTKIVELTIKAELGGIKQRVERCEKDIDKIVEKLDTLKERVDFQDGAELASKIDKLLDDVQALKITDARVIERQITVFKKLGMHDQAKLAEAAKANLSIVTTDGNVQVNQVGKGDLDAGQTGTDN